MAHQKHRRQKKKSCDFTRDLPYPIQDELIKQGGIGGL